MRTQVEEYYGDAVDTAIAADYRLRLPHRQNGKRFYVLRPSGAGLSAILPFALGLQVGGIPTCVVANFGSHSLALKDILGSTLATIAVGQACHVLLADVTLPWGAWVTRIVSANQGTTLSDLRVPVDITITRHMPERFLMRDAVIAMGYVINTVPYALRVTISAGCVVGNSVSTSAGTCSFESGAWPAGSTLLLTLETGARISGRGGKGGRGSDYPAPGLLGSAGSPGLPGLGLSLDTALVNYGTISGGGGGGGGGAAGSAFPFLGPGGGGGGGAGYWSGLGGAAGALNGVPQAGADGSPGTVTVGGAGGNATGGQSGGAGGAPGAAGTQPVGGAAPLGFAGGAAGESIRKLTGITLTKIVAGTIQGPEVFV